MTKDEIFKEALERFKLAADADRENREAAIADVKFAFVPGEQWDEVAKKARGKRRPMYEFNRTRQAIRQVLGDQRRQKPSGKVRGVDSGADPEFAETITGLIRNIESVSNAERAYDTAFEFAVAGGKGAWRICTEYADDTAFEQDIRIKEIANPFAVYFDPAAQEWDRRDGMFTFVVERIGVEEFERKYPDASVKDWEDDSEEYSLWADEETVQVAEYWRKVPIKKTLCLLSNGETVDKEEVEPVLDELAAKGLSVVKEREVDTFRVEQYIVSGGGVISGPTEFASKYIPVIPVWGDLLCVEGKWMYSGLTRHCKDSQRIHNYQLTTAIEATALAPKAPFVLTPTQIKGHEQFWQNANAENLPYLLANSDPAAGGMPKREPPPPLHAAFLSLSQVAADELKATSGIYDASLGARSNETSGKAILARQAEGDTANFAYIDNLARAIKFTWEILIDLLPKVYDTRRTIRVLGEDGAEKWATLNDVVIDQQTGQPVKVHDLSKGRFDVAVTVGPSFQTARMELADSLMGLSQSNPQVGLLLSDLVVRNLDMPGSDEVAKRIRDFLVKQGLVEPEAEEGMEVPPQAQAMIAQSQMILQQQAQAIEVLQQELAKAGQEIETLRAESQAKDQQLALKELEERRLKAVSELERMEADIAKQQAGLETAVAEANANHAAVEKDAAVGTAQVAVQQTAIGLEALNQAIQMLQGQIAEVSQQATAPRVKRTSAQRVGEGQWIVETTEAPAVVNG